MPLILCSDGAYAPPAKLKAAAGRQRLLRKSSFGAGLVRKTRLLVLLCFLFVLVQVGHRVGPFMGWNHHSPSSVSSSSSSSRGGYAVLINTWKRDSLLKQSVAHYASCSCTDSIHIVWSERDSPSDDLYSYLSKIVLSQSQSANKPNFRFELNEEDNLNNRFKPIKDLKNDAIFSVDDDVIVPCSTLNFAFTVWQSASDTMVGFVPRMHWLAEEKGGMTYYKYGGWWSVWWMGTYSIILSKAAFFHRKYLDLYTYKMASSIHNYVTRERNCEDIAMALLIANSSRAPPIWVKGKVYETGSYGISSLKGHNLRRNECLNYFTSVYGKLPLLSTNMKVIDGQNDWFW